VKVLLSWMREFAPIEGDPTFLADTMTDLGMVVEEVTTVGSRWDGIVVAKVLELNKHPKADRIQLVSVDAGAGQGDGEPQQICCGAFNMAVGDLVPLATLGTVMPNGMEIARRKMRGEWSNGMLCSAEELSIGADADGIHILEPGLAVGERLIDVLGDQTDVLFDLDIEGNRPDALSVMGVARDLAARLNVEFSISKPELSSSEQDSSPGQQVSVSIDDPLLCKRFGGRMLSDVSMGVSPGWMVSRLEAAGMRAINSIVDISNYVMLETGQPNHTYDLDKVAGRHLGVRLARDGETLITLDDTKRVLSEADGVIVDGGDTPIGLAGVMGGADSEISDSTSAVLLEAAVWDQMSIAKTSRRLGLRSEASTRFERGADPFGVEHALDRFCELAAEICGATIIGDRLIVEGGYEPTPPVTVRVPRVNMLLNTELTAEQIAAYLEPIGYQSTLDASNDKEQLVVEIPSWRPDSTAEIDVVEEVGRHHGYSKSGLRVPTPEQVGELTPAQRNRRRIRSALIGAGFTQVMPTPFLSPGDMERAGLADDGITLSNPLAADESILCTSLLPGMLKAVAYNEAHRAEAIKVFDMSTTFSRSNDQLPNETLRLAVAEAGYRPDEVAAASATRLLHRLASELGLVGVKVVNAPQPGLHSGRSAQVHFRGRIIGEVGEVDPGVSQAYEIASRVAWLQLAVAPLQAAMETVAKYSPVSRYPSSDVDLAFVVPDDVPATDVVRTISSAGGSLLKSIRLFDAFRSETLGSGVRSLAFGLRFQADDRTLVDTEVAQARQACIDAVMQRHRAHLR